MADALEDINKKRMQDFLSEKSILIVDDNEANRSIIKGHLVELGAPEDQIEEEEDVLSSSGTILADCPQLVFSNTKIEFDAGIDLLHSHLESAPDRMVSGFYLYSEENSVSNACMALDHDIDGFIVSPFSKDSFFKSFGESIMSKLDLDDYKKKVFQGRTHFYKGEYVEGLSIFKDLTSNPQANGTPFYYQGMIYMAEHEVDLARESFEKGIEKEPLGYKCLDGLLKFFIKKGRHKEAYQAAITLVQNFPVSPDKVADIVKISVLNEKFDDVITVSDAYAKVKEKSPRTKTYMAAGLAVTGKHFFRVNRKDDGSKSLEKAAKICEGKKEIMSSITETYSQNGMSDKAEEVLKKYGERNIEKEDYQKLLSIAGKNKAS